ncbi:unnamed protein product [Spirodela intermedia]|uniref:AP2/ERF domain-containing protein n=1 Tax=Spirodela intermedia TaxID=51605 RepID=A0A7I8LE46_SPIIN|nr:unnamed protein product [Spirodela intermedia]
MGKKAPKCPGGSSDSSGGSIENTTSTASGSAGAADCLKVKRTRRSVPRESPSQRSSVYRGVTRHRWTGRFEAHLWDKESWSDSLKKKGRQGAYDDEETAAHAYDLAALKYWGKDTVLNFPLSTYHEKLKEMEGLSREEYIGSLRRKSSGFSRGVSKYRGVARHHHNGRWEARIGRVFGNKYLYLGTYATQEEAATAYDMAAIEYRGLNAVTNFDLSRYVQRLQPTAASDPSGGGYLGQKAGGASPLAEAPPTPPESDIRPPRRRCFPEEVQTCFEGPGAGNLTGGSEDVVFEDVDAFLSTVFQWELDS